MVFPRENHYIWKLRFSTFGAILAQKGALLGALWEPFCLLKSEPENELKKKIRHLKIAADLGESRPISADQGPISSPLLLELLSFYDMQTVNA